MGASRGIGRASRRRSPARARGSRSPAARRSGSRRRPRRSAATSRPSSPTQPTSIASPSCRARSRRRSARSRSSSPTPAARPSAARSSTSSTSGRQAYRSLVLAPRVLADAVVPGMRERGWGRIVNVGSTSTREPIPGLNLSNSHRMAAVGFLKTLAREVAGDGITVNTVATGRFATERLADATGSLEAAEERPRSRSPGRPARPPRGVRRPRRLPLLRARRLHHRRRDPDRRRHAPLGLLALAALTMAR